MHAQTWVLRSYNCRLFAVSDPIWSNSQHHSARSTQLDLSFWWLWPSPLSYRVQRPSVCGSCDWSHRLAFLVDCAILGVQTPSTSSRALLQLVWPRCRQWWSRDSSSACCKWRPNCYTQKDARDLSVYIVSGARSPAYTTPLWNKTTQDCTGSARLSDSSQLPCGNFWSTFRTTLAYRVQLQETEILSGSCPCINLIGLPIFARALANHFFGLLRRPFSRTPLPISDTWGPWRFWPSSYCCQYPLWRFSWSFVSLPHQTYSWTWGRIPLC